MALLDKPNNTTHLNATTKRCLPICRRAMKDDMYILLLRIVNWAQVLDDLRAGRARQDSASLDALLMPFFGGVGAPDLWALISPQVSTVVASQTLGYIARRNEGIENLPPLADSLILNLAPTLSLLTEGTETSVELTQELRDVLGVMQQEALVAAEIDKQGLNLPPSEA